CFNDTRDKVETVCGIIKSLPFPIEWVSYARVDVHIKHPETLDLMVESGCRGLMYGVETFNHEAAKAAGKAVPPEKVKQFFLAAREKYRGQMLLNASFIVGLPHETPASQRATTQWLLEHNVFDWVACGLLGFLHYRKELDQSVLDYADYSRNPKRYGLEVQHQ